MRVFFYTLGCKVNQAEAGGMAALLAGRGHVIVGPEDGADAVVISTCAVTSTADKKSRNAVRKLRARYPGAILCACGCLSQLGGLDGIPGIDIIGGSARKAEFVLKMEAAAERGQADFSLDFPQYFESLPDAPPENRTRVFLKIQDGCRNRCSYCIIPSARGPCRSRPPGDVLSAARKAAEDGCGEIVLTGIEISSYSPSLIDIIAGVCRAAPASRVRIGSLTPSAVTGDFCRKLSELDNLCPHFHLSVQSCCDDVLLRMNRGYTANDVGRALSLIRKHWADAAVSADIIAGFPGESGEQWEETLSFLRSARFASLHVFPYSRRAGTPAASFPGQLTAAQKEARAAAASEIGAETRAQYMSGFIGKTLGVLFETEKGGFWTGHPPQYLPVRAAGAGNLQGMTLPVRITGVSGGVWEGEIFR